MFVIPVINSAESPTDKINNISNLFQSILFYSLISILFYSITSFLL